MGTTAFSPLEAALELFLRPQQGTHNGDTIRAGTFNFDGRHVVIYKREPYDHDAASWTITELGGGRSNFLDVASVLKIAGFKSHELDFDTVHSRLDAAYVRTEGPVATGLTLQPALK